MPRPTLEHTPSVADAFALSSHQDSNQQTPELDLALQTPVPRSSNHPIQLELHLLETCDDDVHEQIGLEGLAPDVVNVSVQGHKDIGVGNGETLLDALEQHDIQLPYQCREGYCGACRCKLVSGTVRYLQDPLAWVNDGDILPCCSIPQGDITLALY